MGMRTGSFPTGKAWTTAARVWCRGHELSPLQFWYWAGDRCSRNKPSPDVSTGL